MTEIAPIVRLDRISKDFRGVSAVKDIDFALFPGEVHALLGENGAGKSTLSKLISGTLAPSAGRILIEGVERQLNGPTAAIAAGIAMVHQETSLVPSMTVAQNLFLGDEKLFNRLRPLNIEAQVFLNSLNFDVSPMAKVASLGAAKRQMVEIARAVRQKARVIIFDEPTATLTPEEKAHFFDLVGRLRSRGAAILFISHALEEALEISDRITVLRDGQLVSTGPGQGYDRARIIREMVGREVASDNTARSIRPRGARMLSVRNLSMGNIVRNNSFTVHAGQVTSFFGLIGSGRTETARIIAGALKRNFFYGGEIRLNDRNLRYRTPRAAMRDGIVYVTEDRKIEGFFEHMNIADNLLIADLAASRGRFLARRDQGRQLQETWSERLSIRAIDQLARVVELSGGNQQKVVIARSLLQSPRLVILDEPTRGVDVGAITEIHNAIRDLADQGLGVIVISSYLPEIMTLSDRILVFRAGRVVEEFAPGAVSEDDIMFAAVH